MRTPLVFGWPEYSSPSTGCIVPGQHGATFLLSVFYFMSTHGPDSIYMWCVSSSASIVSKKVETELRLHCLFPQYMNAVFASVTYLHLTKCSSSNVPPFHSSSGVITKINMVLLDAKHSLHFRKKKKKNNKVCQRLKVVRLCSATAQWAQKLV